MKKYKWEKNSKNILLIEDLVKSNNIQKNVNESSRVTINKIKDKNNNNKNEEDFIQLINKKIYFNRYFKIYNI